MTIQPQNCWFIRPLRLLLCNRYTLFGVGLYVYSLLILLLGGLGGVFALTELKISMLFHVSATKGAYLTHEYWELLLLFYLYGACNLILRPSRWQALVAVLPIALVYLGQDIYYLAYSNVFRLAELHELPELLKVLPWQQLTLLLSLVLVPLGIFLCSVQWWRMGRIVALVLPIALLCASTVIFPERFVSIYQRIGQGIVYWSDAACVELNGRLTMLLYREAERHLAREKTATFRNRSQYEAEAQQRAEWIRTHGNKRNVHLLVLESFLDPTLFKAASYSRDPFHPEFRKFFGDKLGFSLSPVFGGRTSQAEFEALCGVPAFEEISGMEFNSFTGSAAYCLPGILELAGYRTLASNAYNPSFFNTPSGYRGIGFGKIFFPKEYVSGGETSLSTGDCTGESEYMFDGTLFAQNIASIKPLLQAHEGRPFFNYVLGIYGHYPHYMNQEKRPQVLTMRSNFKDEQLERAANQFWYRTQALTAYVKQLIELDPQCLIIVVSDHLPLGQFGHPSFEKLRYLDNSRDSLFMNRILIVEAGQVKQFSTIHHYDIPAIILNSMSDGAYCTQEPARCGFAQNTLFDDRQQRHEDYMRIMAHASE